MANKKIFTDESLATFVDEVKSYTDNAVSGKANSSHNHAASNITSGTLSSDRLPTVPIAKGGTGATTAAAALTNLGITATATELNYVDGVTSNIQTQLDGKAASSHGTHVSYSTTAPVMDGTASVGSASTVARSDHKHPTDTSRASKTEFDTHVADTTKHITSTERTNWNAAKTHADSAHAPSNAEKNQNAFSNVKVGTTTIAADTTTDTLELVGSNVTITPDATNDKVTFSVADGTTSAKGVVQLTNSTSSTSTTTAATPSSVKSAYDLANTAKTNAATAQTRADNAYNLAYSKVDSLSDLGITATAAELNFVDGVTSNIQTQLNGKASSDHTHSSYVNQNAFSNIAVSGQTTVAADTATDTVTFAGSNVTITTNATSDKVTFSVADASTSAKGVVQLVDSATNTATDKAATANAVNTAYTLASKANTTANSAKTTAESKSTVEASSTNGKIKIDGTDTTVYTHPTTAGNKHIPTGGSSGQVLKYSASGTATWGTDKDTTYSLSSGDNNGTIKITPSSGSAYNVAVKGLGSAAYTASTAYASSGHTHALLNNANGGQIGLLYETNDNTLNYFKPYNPVEGHTYNLGSVNNPWDGLYLKNDCNIYGIDTSGDKRINFTPCNYTNNCVVGYDNYVKADGNTNIYGNDVLIFSAAAGNSSARPYWRKGDSINYILHTAGYVTNGGKQVYFTVPLNRIVLGSGLTATAASSDGFILRQDAKYTHGSASSTYVKPTTYNAKIYTNYIYVTATFSSTTNVINNAPCGILWSGTVTIS